ncbi:MAG: hypothetical protein MUC60_04025 [Oscillatoria sp. Prado101]|nr:hypothetical protein [Oscillatoria sp. Prado101]
MILKGARLTGDMIPLGDASLLFHPTSALPAPADEISQGLRAGLRATATCKKRGERSLNLILWANALS